MLGSGLVVAKVGLVVAHAFCAFFVMPTGRRAAHGTSVPLVLRVVFDDFEWVALECRLLDHFLEHAQIRCPYVMEALVLEGAELYPQEWLASQERMPQWSFYEYMEYVMDRINPSGLANRIQRGQGGQAAARSSAQPPAQRPLADTWQRNVRPRRRTEAASSGQAASSQGGQAATQRVPLGPRGQAALERVRNAPWAANAGGAAIHPDVMRWIEAQDSDADDDDDPRSNSRAR